MQDYHDYVTFPHDNVCFSHVQPLEMKYAVLLGFITSSFECKIPVNKNIPNAIDLILIRICLPWLQHTLSQGHKLIHS